jgi:hypothetical protein
MMLAWSPGTSGPVTGGVVVLPDLPGDRLPGVAPERGRPLRPRISAGGDLPADDNWEEWALPATFERMRDGRTEGQRAWQQRVQRTGHDARTLPVALEDAGAAGVITSFWSGGWGVNRIFQARTQRVPTLDLSCEDYGLVYRLAENAQGPQLRVNAEAEFLGEVPAYNTIAEVRGRQRPNEYVMLSAHFDSWDGASGATDNGTGTVVMMEAMRILRQVYPTPRRTILAGHWGGEEQGLNGSRAFVADNPRIVQNLHVLFNQDNGTGRIARVTSRCRASCSRRRASGAGSNGCRKHSSADRDPGARAFPEHRRHGPRLLRVRRSAGVHPQLPVVGLRHVHLAHQPRHVRQDLFRRRTDERDHGRDAGVSRLRGPADAAAGAPHGPGGRLARVPRARARVDGERHGRPQDAYADHDEPNPPPVAVRLQFLRDPLAHHLLVELLT